MPRKTSDPALAEDLRRDRAAWADEEREAAEEEVLMARVGVLDVMLGPDLYNVVREQALREHTSPHALVTRWVAERVADRAADDPETAVADLRRDVERVAKLMRPA